MHVCLKGYLIGTHVSLNDRAATELQQSCNRAATELQQSCNRAATELQLNVSLNESVL
jgi:hypothetical protein